MLGPLIILHEFGHYFAAKLSGVKVLEFGFGFPPRAFGVWTGSTPYTVISATRLDGVDGLGDLTKGEMVAVRYFEGEDGQRIASSIRRFGRGDAKADDLEAVGKIRVIDDGHVELRDMVWSINWLPFGGFVRLLGEEDPDARESLAGKSALTRLGVLIAGVAVNAVIPFVIFIIAVMIPVERAVGDVVVTSVFPDSPAHEAGIRASYKVLSVDGVEIKNYSDVLDAVTRKLGSESHWVVQRGIPEPFVSPTAPKYQYIPGESESVTLVPRWHPPRREVVLEVEDEDTQIRLATARTYDPSVGVNDSLRVVAEGSVSETLRQISLSDARGYVPDVRLGVLVPIVNLPDGRGIPYYEARSLDQGLGSVTYLQEGAVGIQMRLDNRQVETRGVAWTSALGEGIDRTLGMFVLIKNSIVGVASRSNNPRFDGPLAVGPVGLGQLSGEVATADIALPARVLVILTLAAMLSISLAVLNLLPIPGLDGGRMAFVIIEILRRGKRISPEKENLVHTAGFVVLLALLVLVSFSDVSRIFNGESFF